MISIKMSNTEDGTMRVASIVHVTHEWPTTGPNAGRRVKKETTGNFFFRTPQEVAEFKTALYVFLHTELAHDHTIDEGLRRYRLGEPLRFSTGLDERLTWGYGKIDANGIWEFTVPFDRLSIIDQRRIRAIQP